MRNKSLAALWVLLSIGLTASAQNQTEDPMQALKDALSQGQQGSVLQDVLKGNGTGKKTDQKLNTPETMQQKRDQNTTDLFEKANKGKTRDDRIVRQNNEDPELRADDTVLIDMTSLDDICSRFGLGLGGPNSNNGPNSVNGPNGPNPNSNVSALTSAIGGASGAAGAGGIPGLNGITG